MRDALDLLAGIDVLAHRALPCPGWLPGRPGSPERIHELGRRAAAHQGLFLPAERPSDLAAVRNVMALVAAGGDRGTMAG